MRIRRKRTLLFVPIPLALLLLFLPGLPWSKRTRHTLKKSIIKAEMTLARWRGHEPRPISLAGHLPAPGVQVQVIDSRSGWAALSDASGRFVVPDLMWYPGASYELLISGNESTGRLMKIAAPENYPETGVFDAGELSEAAVNTVEISSLLGLTSITREDPDRDSASWYKELFDKITTDQSSDDGKISAICDYVFSKHTHEETRFDMVTPREILETGSRYCGHLSAAMKALVRAGGYTSRGINISDGMATPGTHMILEVHYGGQWHLYDPTYGVKFRNSDGQIASYRDLHLDTSLIADDLFQSVRRKIRHRVAEQIRGMYATGYHHFYKLDNQ